MTLRTPFTEYFAVRHPIALAPMGFSAGGALAAAVSNGGGLGLLGAGRGDREWLARELPIVAEGTAEPWGVGFQSWSADVGLVEFALTYRPRAVMLSFGDPGPFVEPIRQAGAALIIQVTDLDEARQALDADAGALRAYQDGVEHGELPPTPVWVSAAIDLITDLVPAADLVGALVAQAEEALARAAGR